MIFSNERGIVFFIFGLLTILVALVQAKIGIAFSYKQFLATLVYKNERENFYASVQLQLFVGFLIVAISIYLFFS